MSYGNLAAYDYNLLSDIHDYNICFFGNIKYNEVELEKNIRFYPIFRYSNFHQNILKLLSYSFSLFFLVVKIVLLRPKIVHIQWFKFWMVDLVFLRILKTQRLKVIYTAHNVLPHDSINKQYSIYKKYYNLVDHIIVHTKKTKEEIEELFSIPSEKIEVIPHGVLSLKVNNTKFSEIEKELFIKTNFNKKIVFALLGVQSYYKGCDLVVKLWSEQKWLRDNDDYLLLILGKNNNIDYTPLDGINNVYIKDSYISNEEFILALKHTNLLLMPYRKISQSGLLMTAINESVPFLVSSVGALEEPLTISNIGWTIGEPNYENLKECLNEIIINKDDLLEMKNDKLKWEKVQENYSWPKSSLLTSNLYRSVLNDQK